MHRSAVLALCLCLTAPSILAAQVSCPNLRELATQVEFPVEASVLGITEGKVLVSLLLLADGQIADVKVSSSTHPTFEAAAIKLARQLRCDPPTSETRVTLPVSFVHTSRIGTEPSDPSAQRPCSLGSLASAGFPREAARKGLERGSVLLEFSLNPEGMVTEVQVLSSTDEVFSKAAIAMVKDVRCVGVGTAMRVKQQFEFQIQ